MPLEDDFSIRFIEDSDTSSALQIHHDHFEIGFELTGGREYFVNDRLYTIEPGDVFVLNNHDIHNALGKEGEIYRRWVIHFKPHYVVPLCSEKTDLLRCFTNQGAGILHRIGLNGEERQELTELCHRISQLRGYGADVKQKLLLGQILLLVNSLHEKKAPSGDHQYRSQGKKRILNLISIINRDLAGYLNLDSLSMQTGINKYQLCREFKKYSGLTIHGYITLRRIVEAKRLLLEGYNVTEVCGMTGFNDYSHFIRTFSRKTGISPLRFVKREEEIWIA